MDDHLGAFVPHGLVERPPRKPGPLSGVTLGVKDLFDWSGVPTGAGNPDWLASHPVPTRDAGVLSALLDAGATLRGKTVTDELAYSLQGDNVHYGTPVNPAAPDRVPGGSSSGSAAAVAGGLVEAALGTDTGGSVRVPAAYCGVWGLRTTHGLVDRSGLVPLAPTFDTVGWFARTPELLGQLAGVLVPGPDTETAWTRAWTLSEALGLADPETGAGLDRVLGRLDLPIGSLDGLTAPYGGLEGLRAAYVTLQGWEAWDTHGLWITTRKPTFGPAVAQRFEAASRLGEPQVLEARRTLDRFRADLRAALGTGGVLVLPSTPGPGPRVTETGPGADEVRVRTMRLTSPAGLAGLPQVTVPFRGADGLPRGVGLVGPGGSDRALCRLAALAGGW